MLNSKKPVRLRQVHVGNSQFNHQMIHINMADWGLVQLLDLHNLLLKYGYYCNHQTSERFFCDEMKKSCEPFFSLPPLLGSMNLLPVFKKNNNFLVDQDSLILEAGVQADSEL